MEGVKRRKATSKAKATVIRKVPLLLRGLGSIRQRVLRRGTANIHHPRTLAAHEAAVAVILTAKWLTLVPPIAPFSSQVIVEMAKILYHKRRLRGQRKTPSHNRTLCHEVKAIHLFILLYYLIFREKKPLRKKDNIFCRNYFINYMRITKRKHTLTGLILFTYFTLKIHIQVRRLFYQDAWKR